MNDIEQAAQSYVPIGSTDIPKAYSFRDRETKEVRKQYDALSASDWTVDDWRDLYLAQQILIWRVARRHKLIAEIPADVIEAAKGLIQ